MKILHSGDWHIRDKDIEECQKCLGKLVETAEKEKPSVIIIAGDIFDNRNVQIDSDACRLVFSAISRLLKTSPIAVLAGTPSHDGHAAIVLTRITGDNHNLLVSVLPEQLTLDGGWLYHSGNKEGATHDAILSMVPAPTKQFFKSDSDIATTDEEIAAAMTGIFGGFAAGAAEFECPHILVGHFSVRGAAINETQVMIGREIEIGRDQLDMATADVVCLGHIHKAQTIDPNIYYCGSLYRKDFGEMEEKGFWIHEIAQPGEVVSHFVKTPTRKLVKFAVDLCDDTETAVKNIRDLDHLIIQTGKGAIVRIEYRVWQDEADQLEWEKIKSKYLGIGAKEVDIRIIRVPRENVRSEKILKLSTLRDKVAEMARLRGDSVDDRILDKADLLEAEDPDELISSVVTNAPS